VNEINGWKKKKCPIKLPVKLILVIFEQKYILVISKAEASEYWD